MLAPILAWALLAPVQMPPSALKIVDKVPGKGAAVHLYEQVTVDYTGVLANGKKFDSSLDRHQPFTFIVGLGEVIKGWDQGLIGMKPNGTRILTVPPDLGYGAQGTPGGPIPPNATLKFTIILYKAVDVMNEVKKTILKPGKGKGAEPGDPVSIDYTGTLANGKVFDSSVGKTPLDFTLGRDRLITGFTLGVIGMKPGEQRKIVIPAALAYGAKGTPDGVIPPNSALTFVLTRRAEAAGAK